MPLGNLVMMSLIVGLSAALGATLAVLRDRNSALENRETSPRREVPAIWLD